MFKKINFSIIPVQIFLGVFWFKNGFIDKVCGIFRGIVTPETAYQGDTWSGWSGYIVGTWDKSQVAHVILSPLFNILFPVLIVLQCLPFILVIMSILKGEFLHCKNRVWLSYSATASLFVTSVMLFSQTLSGASDGEYLWHLLGLGIIIIMYINKSNDVCNN
ncbi:hypothetical protein F0327_12515 [Citrobacter braakii]|nr:hypothetical protein F0327_12515 [Citrobacter braakii]